MQSPKAKSKPSTKAGVETLVEPKRLEKRRDSLAVTSKILEKEADSLLDVKAGNAEAVFKAEYTRMLRYNSRLIRRFNDQLRQSLTSKDVYALSTLMSQQREVINDLRSITDLSHQVSMVYEQSITPFMSDTTQLITDVYYQLRKLLMETTKPKDTQFALQQLDFLVKQIGIGLQTSHLLLRQSVEQILVGVPANTVNSASKKRSSHLKKSQ